MGGLKKVGVLEVFISVAISVAVIFLFRALDRDNNNMGKITRYVNKRMDDFDDYFKGQHDKLNGLSADLDTHQTTAIAAVKRLEQQGEDFFVNMKRDAAKVVCKEDQHIFMEEMQKKNLLEAMKSGSMKSLEYRLMIDGKPVYHEVNLNGKTH